MEKTALAEMKDGRFARTDSIHRNSIGDPHFPPEHGRYLLVAAYACPWAHRCLIARALYGLEQAIPLATTHSSWQLTRPNTDTHSGWIFAEPGTGPIVHPSGKNSIEIDEDCLTPPKSLGWKSVRDIYEMNGSTTTDLKFTVPILYDLKTNVIVNNESSEILRMLADPQLLGQFATKHQALHLYPVHLKTKIDGVNDFIYTQINDGVYKCGFSNTQNAYNIAATDLQAGLQRVEVILGKSRYLCTNDTITEADIRLFVTLIRHDEVYCVYFKTNHVPIVGATLFPNIVRYMQEILQFYPEIVHTIKMKHIKNHYYTSHPLLNPFGIVPKGPNVLQSLL